MSTRPRPPSTQHVRPPSPSTHGTTLHDVGREPKHRPKEVGRARQLDGRAVGDEEAEDAGGARGGERLPDGLEPLGGAEQLALLRGRHKGGEEHEHEWQRGTADGDERRGGVEGGGRGGDGEADVTDDEEPLAERDRAAHAEKRDEHLRDGREEGWHQGVVRRGGDGTKGW